MDIEEYLPRRLVENFLPYNVALKVLESADTEMANLYKYDLMKNGLSGGNTVGTGANRGGKTGYGGSAKARLSAGQREAESWLHSNIQAKRESVAAGNSKNRGTSKSPMVKH